MGNQKCYRYEQNGAVLMLTFDYNPSTRKLLLKTEDLDLFNRVREHFSIENDAARYGRRYGRYIPRRKYAITGAGACEVGLYWEIKKYLGKGRHYC